MYLETVYGKKNSDKNHIWDYRGPAYHHKETACDSPHGGPKTHGLRTAEYNFGLLPTGNMLILNIIAGYFKQI